MPPYWRRYRRYRTYKRRRPWFPRRRTRKTFRRRNRRKWRRRYKVKKTKFSKKKTKLILKQFQPKTINKCKIIGYKCLFQGNILRANTNYIQYIYAYVPDFWPGGGGWSIMIFSLSSLFEDWQHLQNIWTKSNLGLPLVRYLGCEMKFYQSNDTDYIVVYDNCWPMVDTIDTHADSCPTRMLQRKNKIVIPSRNTQKRKRPYKRAFIKPPTQMTNRWYFQKDLCNTPLLMLTATAVDLTNPFCSPKAKSNNITVTCLSPYQFQNPNFQHLPTSGYSPKELSNGTKLYFYASIHRHITNFNTKSEIQTLIPLLDTKNYTKGKEISNYTSGNLESTYGNPFMPDYLHGDNYTVYITEVTPQTLQTKLSATPWTPPTQSITAVSGPMLYQCRYNPERDTGAKNKAYLVNNGVATKWEPPENKNLYIEGYPLYILLWSFTDWVKKAKQTTNLDQNQVLVIETDQFEDQLALDPHGTHIYKPTQNTNFILNGEAVLNKLQKPMILVHSQNGPLPITSMEDLKYRILTDHHKQNSTHGTGMKTMLKNQLLKELKATHQLMKNHYSPQPTKTTHQQSKSSKKHRKQKKKRRRTYSSSSSTSESSDSSSSSRANSN
nr:MAG: ORF1 [TTV-like mini virus]